MSRLIAPPEWGARIDYRQWTPDPTAKERIALHWNGPPITKYDSGRRFELAALQAIERFHIEQRGWRGIAYSHAIGASGSTYLLRGFAQLGAHAGDYDGDGVIENRETLAVLLILGQGQPMTPAMISALEQLRPELEAQAGRELVLIGHREIAEQGSGTVTSCPGNHVMEYVRAHRRLDLPAPGTPIIGAAETTIEDALVWARQRSVHERFLSVIPLYYEMSPAYQLRPEIGVVQADHETGGGHFGRAVTPGHHNWCGLKVANPTGPDDDPDSHARFPSDRHGVMAHLEHLRLYASGPVPGAIDPRHFPWIAGTAPTVEALGGKWAPSLDYGTKLVEKLDRLLDAASSYPPGLDPYARQAWRWAENLGILSESSRPDATVTDERLAVFLQRYDHGQSSTGRSSSL